MDDKPKRKVEEYQQKTWTWTRTLFVIFLGVAYGFFMQVMFQGKLYHNAGDENGIALVAFLGIVPMMIGALTTYMIPESKRNLDNSMSIAIVSTVLFLAATLVTSSGLIICVLMALPFIFGFVIAGYIFVKFVNFIDKKFIQSRGDGRKKKKYHAFAGFTLLLPLLIAPIELNIESPIWYRNVQDEIIIKASPEDVWDNIIRMETITSDQHRPSIYHTLGIPRPIKATLDHEGIGGVRVGYFEDGLTFVEEITHWDLNQQVRFAVDVRHNDKSTAVLKHIGGRYFDVLEAGYEIVQLDEEHVLLRLDSDYRLSTNFNGYGAFWSDWIMHDFQMYVLTTVKMRVES